MMYTHQKDFAMFNFFKSLKLAVVFAVFVTLFGCKDSSPEGVAKSYVTAIYNADVKEALSYVSFDAKSAEESAELYKMVEGKFEKALPAEKQKIEKRFGGVKSIDVKSIDLNEDNDAAMVVVEVTFKESNQGIDSKKEKVRVKKINDEWKVNL